MNEKTNRTIGDEQRKHGRVLLADRHPEMLEGVRGLLETAFDAVVMVADESSLLEAAERLQPDLVVVDLSLKAARGVNVVRRVKDRVPGVKVLALSVHDEPAAVREAMAAGAAGYVLKRTAATDLIPAVEAALEGRTFVSLGPVSR